MILPEYAPFPKIPRLRRQIVITEKIDGTNALIHVTEAGQVIAGSRTRWITPDADNFGFARWVADHTDELLGLGPGSHYGEWWGSGIQRKYGLSEKRFSLFNTGRWNTETPPPVCCSVVPVLALGAFSDELVGDTLSDLRHNGSKAAPGFPKPEGICVYHTAIGSYFKVTIEGDAEPKGKVA